MLDLILLLVSVIIPSGEVSEGILSQYDPGVMPYTVEARQGWGQLPEDLSDYAGAIAVVSCDDIGRSGMLSIEGSAWVKVIVADCSGHLSTTRWMTENNIIAEISGELAQEFDVVCKCPIDGRIIWLD